MQMSNEKLPLGSIVYLEDGTKKIMVVGRGVVTADEEESTDVFFDYIGCGYPEGIDPDDAIFFNEENIDEVLFKGYADDEEERFLTIYRKWEDGLTVEKKQF